MIKNEEEVLSFLSTFLFDKKKIVFIGLGNSLRGNDIFGIMFTRKLKAYLNGVYNEEDDDVEGILLTIINSRDADVVFFVDAVKYDTLEEGTIILCDIDEIKYTDSTHKFPIHIYTRLLQKRKINAYLIGLKTENFKLSPSGIKYDEKLNEKIDNFLEKLVRILSKESYS